MRNAGLNEAQAGIKIAGRNINNLSYADDTILIGRKLRWTKKPPDESERGEWKSWLKFNIQKTNIMVSGPITSWQIDGKQWKQWQTLFWGGFKITTDGDCCHEIKRCLLLGRKAISKLDSILKSRDTTLLTKVHLIKTLFFPVVMDGCESWTIKKAEWRKNDAFELWCWRRLLRVPWTARRFNTSQS